MQQNKKFLRVLCSLLAAALAAWCTVLLCRWVGYDLQERLGNTPRHTDCSGRILFRMDRQPAGMQVGAGIYACSGRAVRRSRDSGCESAVPLSRCETSIQRQIFIP